MNPFQNVWYAAPARRRKISEPRQPVTSKYDPFHQLFSAEGPSSETGSLDPLGAVLQSLRQPWDRPPSSKYDVFQAIFALEGPNAQRPSLDPLSALQQDGSMQPEESVKSKYDPFQALFNMEGPDAQRSGSRPTTPSVPTESVKSKYDPFQALFNMEGPDAQRPGLEQKAPSPPTESVKSKYDPFQALFQQEGPSSDKAALDPLGSLLQGIQRPRRPASSKYDVFQAILKLRGPSKQAPPLDPFGAALSDGKQPHQAPRSKYDPFQALFQSQMPAGDAPLDPLPHLIKAMTASSLLKKQQEQQQQSSGTQSDRFNPLQRLLSVEPPTGRTPGFDPLGALLKSSWVKDRRSRAEREPRREEDSREFGQAYSGPQGRQPSPSRGPRQIDDQQDMAQLMQQRATRQQPRQQVGEHEARERAMAALQVGFPANTHHVCGLPVVWSLENMADPTLFKVVLFAESVERDLASASLAVRRCMHGLINALVMSTCDGFYVRCI